MPTPVKIIGSYLSPYVRKVLAVLHWKQIAYEIDPIVAFMGDERFSRLSPVRRIPVLIDDRVTLCDSSVICQYLEDRYPRPHLYPADVADRARARWLEEYADTRMGDVFIWQLFDQVAIGPYVWGRKTDEIALRKTLREEMPQVLGYLESVLPRDGFVFGELSIADISIAVFFRNATFARYAVDAQAFPRTAAFVERVLAQECLARLRPFEEKMLRVPIARQREALIEMGAPIMAETYGTATPRRGLMRI
jgi:glutathione S-transferase